MPNKNFRPRWSLRAFLIATTLVAVVVGLYLGRVVDRRRAISSVARLSPNSTRVLIEYDYEFDKDGKPIANAQSHVPQWLLNLAGTAPFHAIVGIDMDGEKVTMSDLTALRSLPKLKRLDLEWNQLSPECLDTISKLTGLTRLDLQETEITNDDLRCVETLDNMQTLLLSGEQLTDACFAHLKNMQQLRSVSVRWSSANGTGLDQLTCEDSLESIDLRGSPVSDLGITSILRFRNLVRLNVDSTKASEQSLAQLKQLPLQELTLPRSTARTAIEQLREAMPDCNIETR